MKIDKWDDIPEKNFPRFQGTPLAFFGKNTSPAINCPESIAVYEDNGRLFIGNSGGERRNITFNILSKLKEP